MQAYTLIIIAYPEKRVKRWLATEVFPDIKLIRLTKGGISSNLSKLQSGLFKSVSLLLMDKAPQTMKDGRATEMVLSCHLLALHGVKRCGDVCTLLLQMMYVRFNRLARGLFYCLKIIALSQSTSCLNICAYFRHWIWVVVDRENWVKRNIRYNIIIIIRFFFCYII